MRIPSPGIPGTESTSPTMMRVSATAQRTTRFIRSSIGWSLHESSIESASGTQAPPHAVLSSVYGAGCVLRWSGPMVYSRERIRQFVRRSDMPIGRMTKIAAGIIFVVAALGVAAPVLLVPLGLAVWVFGEVL